MLCGVSPGSENLWFLLCCMYSSRVTVELTTCVNYCSSIFFNSDIHPKCLQSLQCNGRISFTLKSERFNMTITEGKHNKLSRCQFNRFRVSCTFSHRSLKACKHGLYAMMVKIPSKMEIANYESEPSEISRSRKISWDFALDFVSKRLENRDRERKNLDLVSKNEIRKAKISISSRKTR